MYAQRMVLWVCTYDRYATCYRWAPSPSGTLGLRNRSSPWTEAVGIAQNYRPIAGKLCRRLRAPRGSVVDFDVEAQRVRLYRFDART